MKRFIPLLAAILLAASLPAMAQKVRLATSAGDIVLQLEAEKTPKSTANFLQYVRDGHYDGTIFHRVIQGFMLQGGGFDADMQQKPSAAPIQNEAGNGLKNKRYTLAMARTSAPHSASSQFFINTADNAFLDQPNARDGHGYAVFGRVVEGMDVVEKIRAVPTQAQGMHQNLPVKPVILQKATVEK